MGGGEEVGVSSSKEEYMYHTLFSLLLALLSLSLSLSLLEQFFGLANACQPKKGIASLTHKYMH